MRVLPCWFLSWFGFTFLCKLECFKLRDGWLEVNRVKLEARVKEETRVDYEVWASSDVAAGEDLAAVSAAGADVCKVLVI